MRQPLPAGIPEAAAHWFSELELDDAPADVDQGFRESCLKVCAVLAQFSLEGLKDSSGPLHKESVEETLEQELVPLPTLPGTPQLWTLTPAARAEGLKSMWTLPVMWSVRQLNPLPTPLPVIQEVFDEFLQGDHSAVTAQTTARIEAAIQVAEWLAAFDPTIPQVKTIERSLSRRRLMQPMERITRGFMGRASELAELRGFVGVLDAQTPVEGALRFLGSLLNSEQKAPLLIYGIGGIGKSTLLAEFIRQHETSPVPFPYVYLDFDNPRLNVKNLGTLVNEMADQLEAQYPGSEWSSVRAAVKVTATLTEGSDYDSSNVDRTLTVQDLSLQAKLRDDSAVAAARSCADALRRTMEASSLEKMMHVADVLPFLVVLDTFEEVQKRGVETAGILWAFLSYLQRHFPKVRIVVSGRAQVPELVVNSQTAREIALKEFDESSAISLLMQSGVSDFNLCKALYKQVGGNPLSLKLAAQVAKLDDTSTRGIEGLKTTSYLIFSAAETVIQGQLYRRILLRIPDDDVRALAHPGLVVRRLTAPIIRQVLAVPCGLGEITEKRSQQLFESLKKQVDLVTSDGDGLRHQQDIRRVMLKLLEEERRDTVMEIHRRAFEYYEDLQDPVSRTEKLYHALQLVLDEKLIRQLWTRDAEESLLSSIDEFPPVSRLLLHELTHTTPSGELRKLADLDQWERVVEVKCRREIRYGYYAKAKELLSERSDRTVGSGLYALEATCCIYMGDLPRAAELLQTGIDSAQSINRMDRLVELWRLRGDVYERQSNWSAADQAMATAQNLAGRIGSAVLQLQIFCSRLRYPQMKPPISELDDILTRTSDTDFASVRLQIQGLFANCGPDSDLLLRKGLRTLKLREAGELEYNKVYGDLVRHMVGHQRANEILEKLLNWSSGQFDLPRSEEEKGVMDFFKGLADRTQEQQRVRYEISSVLETALNPNFAVRSA
jgi:hypothetical protein